jgi:hypothetical protein
MVRFRARLRIAAAEPDEVSVSGHLPPGRPPMPGDVGGSCLCDVGTLPHGLYGSRVAYFATAAEAARFAETVPCPNPHCRGLHIAVLVVGGKLSVRVVGGARPRPLAEELARCYPRRPPPYGESDPQWWTAPLEFNEPLDRPVRQSSCAERINRQNRRP